MLQTFALDLINKYMAFKVRFAAEDGLQIGAGLLFVCVNELLFFIAEVSRDFTITSFRSAGLYTVLKIEMY